MRNLCIQCMKGLLTDHICYDLTLWLLFSGVSRFVSAFDLRACGVRGWGWILAVGVILIAAGFVCMMDPWVSVAAIGVTVGLVFLLEGVSAVVYACIPRDK